MNSNHTMSKCWLDEDGTGGLRVPTGKGSRLIILHAGSSNGFVPNGLLCFKSNTTGDYHEEMDSQRFQRWFEEQLLPNIPESSVIVMDNASYHSSQIDRCPTSNSKKTDMQLWLNSHNIAYDSSMIRPQLYELIKLHKPNHPSYAIDTLAAQHGHDVVRLPPYHCELNPIELIWAQIKGGVAVHNTQFTISHVKTLLQEEIVKVTAENWRKACEHVKTLEDEIYTAEIKIDSSLSDEQTASFRFYLDETDSSSDDDSEDDSWPSDSDCSPDDLMWIPDQGDISDGYGEDEAMPEFPLWSTSTATLHHHEV